jgi:hypothetical protein
MKNGHLVSLAVPLLLLGACGGGGAGMTGDTANAGTGGATAGAAGGTTGAAGATGAAVDCTMDQGTTADTVSDFEDGTGSVLASEMRNGGWYSYVDPTATCMVVPAPNATATAAEIPGGRCMSMFAMHFTGMGCTTWGAGVGTDLAAPAAAADAGVPTTTAMKVPYDVSGFTGVSFWSRADKGSSMRFKMPMTDDTKVSDGGKCVEPSATSTNCSDDFGANIALTSKWVKHTVTFSTMKQEGWGKVFPWTPGDVTSIQFQVPAAPSFDVWIDDVSFVK